MIVQQPIKTKIAGFEAVYARFNYYVSNTERIFPTTSELWIIPRENFFFMIGAGIRQDEKTGSRKEIQDILDTLVIK